MAAQRQDLTVKDQLLNPNYLQSLSEILPQTFSAERMVRLALSSMAKNKKLMECEINSLRFGIVEAARLGFEIGGPLGMAYLTPRKDRGVLKAVLVIGYQGMVDLALRTGLVSSIMAEVVREGDRFLFEYGTEKKLRHVPSGDPDAPVTHAYAIAEMQNGAKTFHVMSRKEIDRVRTRAGAGDNSPWSTDYAEMARKTAIRNLFKFLPKTSATREVFAPVEAADPETTAIIDARSDAAISGDEEIIDPGTGEILAPTGEAA